MIQVNPLAFLYLQYSSNGKKSNSTGKQLAFYWINDDQELVTCVTRSESQKFN